MGWWARLFGPADPPPEPAGEDLWWAACAAADSLVHRHDRLLRDAGTRYHFRRRLQDMDSGAVVEINICDPMTLAEHHPQGLSSEICIGHYLGTFVIWVLGGPLPNGHVGLDQHALGHSLGHYANQVEGGEGHRDDADHMWEGVS